MDRTTEMLSSYACNLSYEDLPPEVIHQVKRTVADTLGCAIGGYLSEPAKIARKLAGDITSGTPSRILGTNDYTSLDMAGFANGVMVRYLDCNDSYFSPGGGHPSDMIPASLAVAGQRGRGWEDADHGHRAVVRGFLPDCGPSAGQPVGSGNPERDRSRVRSGQGAGAGRGADGARDLAGGGAQRTVAGNADGRAFDVEGLRGGSGHAVRAYSRRNWPQRE